MQYFYNFRHKITKAKKAEKIYEFGLLMAACVTVITHLKLHPSEEVASLAPAALLAEDDAHLAEGEPGHERRHGLAHVGGRARRRGAHRADGGDHVAAVHVPRAVVLDVPGHLVRGAAHPPRRVGARALAPARAPEPLGLVAEEAPVRLPAARRGQRPGGRRAAVVIVIFVTGSGGGRAGNGYGGGRGRCGPHWSVAVRSGSHCHGRGRRRERDKVG